MKLPIIALCSLLTAAAPVVAQEAAPRPTLEETMHFKAAADYSKAARGVAMLVMRNGEIIFEDYAPIWNASKPHLLASGTKAFVGVLAACAVQDRLMTFDEKASDTLDEWRDGSPKEKVTIRQLLSMSSGIEGGENPSASPLFQKSVDIAYLGAEPGEKFSFGPIPYQCFGEILRRKLKPKNESVYDYLDRRLLAPIGLRVSFWRRDGEENMNMPSGAFLTAREWAKFGELMRTKGRWEGRLIVTPAAIGQCVLPGQANPAYGLGWWLLGADEGATAVAAENRTGERQRRELEERKSIGFHVPRDTWAALGKGGQGCYIIPSQKMVVIRLGDSDGRVFTDNQFLARVLGKPLAKAQ